MPSPPVKSFDIWNLDIFFLDFFGFWWGYGGLLIALVLATLRTGIFPPEAQSPSWYIFVYIKSDLVLSSLKFLLYRVVIRFKEWTVYKEGRVRKESQNISTASVCLSGPLLAKSSPHKYACSDFHSLTFWHNASWRRLTRWSTKRDNSSVREEKLRENENTL